MPKNWSKGKEFAERTTCDICGELFYCAPCYKKRGGNSGKYCSRKCSGIAYSKKCDLKFSELREQRKREKDIKSEAANESNQLSFYKKRISIKKCKYCGSETTKIFCDKNCYYNYIRKEIKPSLTMCTCKNCEKEFEIKTARINVGEGIFCSLSCARVFLVKTGQHKMWGNSKGGKREDLENRYFRSRWEANYARYLNFLIKAGEVIKWEYEIETFYFENIKRGIRSYTPDFKVYYSNGDVRFIEIKGYMDEKSKVKMKRMNKYYPSIKVELFDSKRYRELSIKVKSIIPNWETDSKKKI